LKYGTLGLRAKTMDNNGKLILGEFVLNKLIDIDMRYLLTYIIIIVLLPSFSCGHPKKDEVYIESNYVKVKHGRDSIYPYIILYQNRIDTNYSRREIFFDSNYTQPLSKFFYYKNVLEGPFFIYVNGSISMKGQYKQGKKDGVRLTYEDGKVQQKAYFKDGIKTGTWEEYNVKGKLIRKTTYDKKANVIDDTKF